MKQWHVQISRHMAKGAREVAGQKYSMYSIGKSVFAENLI